MAPMSRLRLTQLTLYPIKSIRGLEVAEARIEPRGLERDRRWMIVDAENRFVTQREHPELARISLTVDGGQTLRLEADGLPALTVPWVPASSPRRSEVQVWRDRLQAQEGPGDAGEWLSRFLGFTVRLVYQPESAHRAVDANFGQPGDHVSFADGFPLLVVGEASLADLNARMAAPIGMTRFRPNLVIAGSAPFAEDRWRRLRIGEVTVELVKPCARCVLTTVDERTGTRGKEPLATLSTYRRRDGQVYFGQNGIPRSAGMLRVGDPVSVLEEAS
jgi:uncharacterized protein YcbX